MKILRNGDDKISNMESGEMFIIFFFGKCEKKEAIMQKKNTQTIADMQ
jgi:hypothetical protein